jgi:hypothetical protein
MSLFDDATFITGPAGPGAPLTEADFNAVLEEVARIVGPLQPYTWMPASPEHKAWFCERHPEASWCQEDE